MPHSSRPPITILLCTMNGARHLHAQLESYLRQSHRDWALWVSDDGSTDGTPEILEAFRATHGAAHDIRILRGPGRGAAQNFLSLLCHPDLPAGPVALSDQDDIWLPGKLARALDGLAAAAGHGAGAPPAVYGAQSLHVDGAGRALGPSRVPPRPPGFANALVQNVISGHSAALNAAALALLRRAGPQDGIPFHDWWLYLLVSAAAGRVVVDPRQVLLYRQHDGNVMGAHRGLTAQASRLGMILGRDYQRWMAANMQALAGVAPLLSPEARVLLDRLRAAPPRPGPGRVRLLRRLGLHRQSRSGTAFLCLAALLGRV